MWKKLYKEIFGSRWCCAKLYRWLYLSTFAAAEDEKFENQRNVGLWSKGFGISVVCLKQMAAQGYINR